MAFRLFGFWRRRGEALRGKPPRTDDDDRPLEDRRRAVAAATLPTEIVKFRVEPAGEPQNERAKYYVVDENTGTRFYVGFVDYYYSRKGIARYSEEVIYDRFAEEKRNGLWAHFVWPTVMAEGAGQHLVVNCYDRAAFTWGFYQLAAHTADDNLILLMRELLKLPTAKFYFPDLALVDGKVAKVTPGGTVSLERAVWSSAHREHQIPDFMAYMNPSDRRVENIEVINAAKFLDWARRDPLMLAATVQVSMRIMKGKVAKWADKYHLVGRRPELAIWISDMFHQGRGDEAQAKRALTRPTLDQQLEALSTIDTSGQHATRRATVKSHVQKLRDERRFDGVEFGKGPLALDADPHTS